MIKSISLDYSMLCKKNREKIEKTYVLHSRGILINYITALKRILRN